MSPPFPILFGMASVVNISGGDFSSPRRSAIKEKTTTRVRKLVLKLKEKMAIIYYYKQDHVITETTRIQHVQGLATRKMIIKGNARTKLDANAP